MKSILIAASSKDIISPIKPDLGTEFHIQESYSSNEAISLLNKKRPDLFFIDLAVLRETSDDLTSKEILNPFLNLYPTMPIVVMTPQQEVRYAVQLIKMGAFDYLTYPLDPEEVRHVIYSVNKSLIIESELDYLRGEFWSPEWLKTVHTNNPAMIKVYDKVKAVAPTKSTVLITGETGTGKGVIANVIHRHSNRRDAQFISIHCGAIPDTLLESEFFGHEKGSFTGAVKRKLGKFEIASGGTIFLDEVGTITSAAQIKLLQVLQEGVFQRVGGEDVRKSDARIIAASNVDLKKMCDDGTFRNDLYYRLNVFPIEVPPLRERIEDIPNLAEIFLTKLNKFYNKDISQVHPDVIDALICYSWPGNIRELENLIERAYILEVTPQLTTESFPTELFENRGHTGSVPLNTSMTLSDARRRAVESFERMYLVELLSQNKGKVKISAGTAGITTRQLNKLMSKYGIKKEQFK
ncbi:sigma-54-dependent transcriptional regulator [Thermodesulfobacteriota bacterium]